MRKSTIFLILPFGLLNGVVLITALFKSVEISLGYDPVVGLTKISGEYYLNVWKNPEVVASLVHSLGLAVIATGGALVLGLGLAIVLRGSQSRFSLIKRVFVIPITMPYVIVALTTLQILSQSGIISRIAYHLVAGRVTVDNFPLLVNDHYGIGIIVTFLYKEIPYAALTMLVILRQLQGRYSLVATNLGASKWQVFWRVTLPLLQTTIIRLFIILFCFTFTSFEVPYLLENPRMETVSVLTYDWFTQPDLTMRSQSFALNVTVSSICLIVTFVALGISNLLPGGKVNEKN